MKSMCQTLIGGQSGPEINVLRPTALKSGTEGNGLRQTQPARRFALVPIYLIFAIALSACEAGYVVAGAAHAIDEAGDAAEERVIAEMCADDPGAVFCPGRCDVNPSGFGCPGGPSFCEIVPDAESCA